MMTGKGVSVKATFFVLLAVVNAVDDALIGTAKRKLLRTFPEFVYLYIYNYL